MNLRAIALVLSATALAACGGEEAAEGDAGAEGPQDIIQVPPASAPPPVAAVDDVPPVAAAEDVPPIAPNAGVAVGDPQGAVIEAHELSASFIAILVDERLVGDPLELEAIGRSFCEGRTGCRAVIWFDRGYLPLALPVDARQTEASVFAFSVNIAGREAAEWNCALFPEAQAAGQRCLPTTERML
jgi:hypothetical protein